MMKTLKKILKSTFSIAFMGIILTNCSKDDNDKFVSGSEYEVKKVVSTSLTNGFFFLDENKGFAVGNNGIVLSTIDSGESWQEKSLGNFTLNDIAFYDENIGYIVGTNEYIVSEKETVNGEDATVFKYLPVVAYVFKTNDGGVTWEKNRLNDSVKFHKVVCINDSSTLLMGLSDLVLSTNGQDWLNLLNTGNENDPALPSSDFDFGDCYKTGDSSFIVYGAENSLKTNDLFESWQPFYLKIENFCIYDNNGMLSSRENTILTSENGIDWELYGKTDGILENDRQYAIKDIESISDNYLIITNGYQIFRTRDGGKNWDAFSKDIGRFDKFQKLNDKYIYSVGRSYNSGIGESVHFIKINLE